jgi:hypothetical protein
LKTRGLSHLADQRMGRRYVSYSPTALRNRVPNIVLLALYGVGRRLVGGDRRR